MPRDNITRYSSLHCSHVSRGQRGQSEQTLCAGIVHNASLCLYIGTYGEASGQWCSCHAGLNKEAKTGSDRRSAAMPLGCVCVCVCVRESERGRKRDRVCFCVGGGYELDCACQRVESSLEYITQ